MRLVVLKDWKIKDTDYQAMTAEFSDFIYDTIGIAPTFFTEIEDYTNIPTFIDADRDVMPTEAYFKQLTDRVYKKYGTWGTDSIVLLVHRDHWVFKGIWGTNKSNVYHQYHVHLCRFDNQNIANSIGTLYHEWMHSLDVLIKTHTGIDINEYFKKTRCWVNWDSTVVHSNRFAGCKETPFKYIQYKENIDALKMIAPDLKKAYNKRKEMYYQPYLTVLTQAVAILRSLLNKKKQITK